MYRQRFLAWLCSFCLIFSALSGVAYGAGISNIEDLDIDPWGEFNSIPLPSVGNFGSVAVTDDITETDREGVYALDPDAGIIPLALIDGDMKYSIALSGFTPTGVDSDGDEWQAGPVSFVFAPSDDRDYTNDKSKVGGGTANSFATIAWRSLKVPGKGNKDIPISEYAQWIGRPPIINGDVNYTNRSNLGFSSGDLHIRLDSWQPTEGVESITLSDFVFGYYPWYTRYQDAAWTNNWGTVTYDSAAEFYGAYLYVNGSEYARLLTSSSGLASFSPGSAGSFRCEINTQTVKFDDKPYIETLEIVLSFGLPGVRSKYLCDGGWSVMLGGSNTSGTAAAYRGATISVQSDMASANNGLLKNIIEFLKSIVSGIGNIASSIAKLPGLIADAIINGLKSLFVPEGGDLQKLKNDYQTMLETKFGFIYQCFQLLETTISSLVDGWGNAVDYSFDFPGISFELQGQTMTLIQPQKLSLDNALMDVLRPVAGTSVSFIAVMALVHAMENMFIAIISGKNYFDYINSAYDTMEAEGLLEEDEMV